MASNLRVVDDSLITTMLGCPTLVHHTAVEEGQLPLLPVDGSIHHSRRMYLDENSPKIVIGNYLNLYEPRIVNYKWVARQFPNDSYPIHSVLEALKSYMVNFDELEGQGYHAVAFPRLEWFDKGTDILYRGHPNYIVWHPNRGFVPIFGLKLKQEQAEILGAYYCRLLKGMGYESEVSGSLYKHPFWGWQTREHSYKSKAKAVSEVVKSIIKIANEPEHMPPPVWKPDTCLFCPQNGIGCFAGRAGEINLTLLTSIGPKTQDRLINVGIPNIEDLANCNSQELQLPRLERLKGFRKRITNLQPFAIAYQQQETVIHSPIKVPKARHSISFDVETLCDFDHEGKPFWRIFHNGAYYYDWKRDEGSYIYTIARCPELRDPNDTILMNEAEKVALRVFWEELQRRTNYFKSTVIYHYGPHDINSTLKASARLSLDPDSHPLNTYKRQVINGLQLMKTHVTSPTGYSLKKLTGHLGYKWQLEVLGKRYNATAPFAAMMYKYHLASQGTPAGDAYEQGMAMYNRQDCQGQHDVIYNLHTGQGIRVGYEVAA